MVVGACRDGGIIQSTMSKWSSATVQQVMLPTFSEAGEAIRTLRAGADAVVLRLAVDHTALDEALEYDRHQLFAEYNRQVKPEFQVPSPTLAMLYDPNHVDWAPYIGKKPFPGRDHTFSVYNLRGGMVNHYQGALHKLFGLMPAVQEVFSAIAGTADWRLHPNRMRLNLLASNTPSPKITTAHLEGPDAAAGTEDSAIAMILNIFGRRSFVYYQHTTLHPALRKYYLEHGGATKGFVKVPEPQIQAMGLLKARSEVIINPFEVLLFREGCLHEVSNAGSSLGLFFSVFNPTTEHDYIPRRTALQASGGQPIEFAELTQWQSELVGLRYHLTGTKWPSGKTVFTAAPPEAGSSIQRMQHPNRLILNPSSGKYSAAWTLPSTATNTLLEGDWALRHYY